MVAIIILFVLIAFGICCFLNRIQNDMDLEYPWQKYAGDVMCTTALAYFEFILLMYMISTWH